MKSMQKQDLTKAVRIARGLFRTDPRSGHWPEAEELKALVDATEFAVKLWTAARMACWNIPRGCSKDDVTKFLAETRMDLAVRIGLAPKSGRKAKRAKIVKPRSPLEEQRARLAKLFPRGGAPRLDGQGRMKGPPARRDIPPGL